MDPSASATEPFHIALAPEQLWQSINPWTLNWQGADVGNITINLGHTPQPALERKILNEVGSYGRQIGRISEALEVLVKHFDPSKLDEKEQDALTILLGQIAEIRQIKAEQNALPFES